MTMNSHSVFYQQSPQPFVAATVFKFCGGKLNVGLVLKWCNFIQLNDFYPRDGCQGEKKYFKKVHYWYWYCDVSFWSDSHLKCGQYYIQMVSPRCVDCVVPQSDHTQAVFSGDDLIPPPPPSETYALLLFVLSVSKGQVLPSVCQSSSISF